MAQLPFDRYHGIAQPCAIDNDGKIFFALQDMNNMAHIVMDDHGTVTDITDQVVPAGAPKPAGPPTLDTSATWQGLWFIGNQEVPLNSTPPRYPVPQFTIWPQDQALLNKITALEQQTTELKQQLENTQ